jgi:tetratricopeptide (TPR) repeat protein
MNSRARLTELLSKRSNLKLRGRTRWMVVVQREIVAESTRLGCIKDMANAWNYLSILLHEVRDYAAAADAARNALWVYSIEANPQPESLGSYHLVLARILAAQERWEESVVEGERAVECLAIFHDPPDEFLTSRIAEIELMRRHRDMNHG